jgi:hypothetical protein
VTRFTRRRIERVLRLPAPAPGDDLGRRIKDQIPQDLFASSASERRDEGSRPSLHAGAAPAKLSRPALWAVAASVMAAIGAGWLAVRMFETGEGREPAAVEVASRRVPAASPRAAASPAAEAEQDGAGPPPARAERKVVHEQGKLEDAGGDRLAQASSRPPELERRATPQRQLLEEELAQSAPRDAAPQAAAAAASRAEPVDVGGREPAHSADLENESSARGEVEVAAPARLGTASDRRDEVAVTPRPAEVETQSDELADLAVAARSAEAETARSEVAPAAPSADRQQGGLARETRSLRVDRVAGAATRAIDNAGVVADRTWRLVDSSLAAQATSEALPSPAAISIVGSKSHLPGRVVLWVSATVPSGDLGNRARAADAIELELDPGLVRGRRLLASDARPIAAGSSAARSGAQSAPTVPGLERVTVLYEIEIGRLPEHDAVLGTAGVRDGRAARRNEESSSRDISVAGLTRDWRTNAPAFQLAVLGAEIASLPDDASPDVVASLRAELERLRAESSGDDARRAGELLAVLPR